MKYIQILFVLLLLTPLALGIETIIRDTGTVGTSRPLIIINYNENPITIDDYWLNYTSPPQGIQLGDVGLSYVSSADSMQFNFTMEDHLWDDEYTLYARAHDPDQNELEFYVNFVVEAVEAEFNVDSPSVPFDYNYDYAFYHELPMDMYMSIDPSYPIGNCYFTYMDLFSDALDDYVIEEPTEDLFFFMRSQELFDPREPYIPYVKNYTFTSESVLGGNLYDEGDIERIYVLCNRSDLYLTEYYYGILWVGYDTTPPQVEEFSFEPSTIYDAYTPTADLHLVTDDRTVCWIDNIEYPEGYSHDLDDSYFDFNHAGNYTYDKNYTLSFGDVARNGGYCWNQVCDYTYNVTCMNMASNLSTERTATLSVALDHDLDARIENNEMVQSTGFTLNVTTNIYSRCNYEIDDIPQGQMNERELLPNGRYQHTTSVELPGEGTYLIDVECISYTSPATASDDLEVTVDSERPVMEYVEITSRPMCGNTVLTAELSATDTQSDIDFYNYTILNGSQTVFDWSEDSDGSISIIVPAEEGTTYTVRAYAHDEAGWQSQNYLEDTVTYYEPGHVNCDATDPTTTYDLVVRDDGTGYDLTIYCSDEGSGCTETAHLYEADSGTACSENAAEYTGTQSIDVAFSIDETQRICWYVEDNAQNKAFGAVDVSGNVNIELIEPRFGVSYLKSFPLLFESDIPAHCLQGELLSTHQSMNDMQRYADLASRGTSSEFDISDGREHRINNFNALERGAAEYFDDWLVACNSSGVYNSGVFVLGYDTTPPEFELSADPNPLQEPTETSSTLYINSLDDDVLCNYLQPTNPPYTAPPQRYYFYSPENPDDRDQYVQSYSTRLPENDNFFFMTSTYTTYPYFVTCYNPAGNFSEQGIDVVVDPINEMAVTIGTPSDLNTNNVLINATTLLSARCKYSWDGDEPQDLSSNDDHYHYVTRSASDGDHHLVINCESIYSSQLYGTAETPISIDSTAPTIPEITVTSPTCSLDNEISVRLQVEEESLDYYEYELEQDSELVGTFTVTHDLFELPVSPPYDAGTTFALRARAVDQAGNEGGWSSATTIEVTDDSDPSCDFNPPTGWAELTDTPDGASVEISCLDEESGCTDSYGYSVISQGGDCDEVSYSSRSYGDSVDVTEDQLLCWQVEDHAGNTAQGAVDITVSLDIQLVTPSFGVGSTQTYDLTFSTDRSAQCRLGFVNPQHPQNIQDWYGQLQDSFDVTGANTHRINDFNIIDFGATTCQGQSECTENMVIICSEASRYHYKLYDIGFDTSPPEITTWANPNPVVEPQNLQSTLYVTADDEVWCSFATEDGSYAFYQYPDITNPDQYQTELEKWLGYFEPPAFGETYVVDYDITCVNFAQAETTDQVSITISPLNQVTITINTPDVIATRTVPVDVSTDLPSTCHYRFDANHPPRPMTSSDGLSHTASYTLSEDGIYDLIVDCSANSGPYNASLTQETTVDATGPQMLEIATNDYTCSLTELSATFIADASVVGLSQFEYSIFDNNEEELVGPTSVDASGTLDITESLDLIAGETYHWQVSATDNLDRQSSIISRSVVAQDETYETCDFVSPVGSLSFQDVYGGAEAYVECSDEGSGCSENYDYAFEAGAVIASCQGEFISTSTNVIPIDQSGTICYLVYDQAGNSDDGSGHHTIYETCSNGIQDPDEEGVDCGGNCPASCGTCSNGVQDPDEEGVDCGGVCPESCLLSCGNGVIDAGEECDGGTDLTCEYFGMGSGMMSCTDQCTLSTESCIPDEPICGDGVVDAGEDCDGTTDVTCEDFGLGSGTITCDDCQINTLACEGQTGVCGDGVIGPGESCDGGVSDQTCEDYGLRSGSLACVDCQIVTDDCFSGICGDGNIDQGESCDGLNWGSITECSDISDGFISGMPVCGFDCHFETETCIEAEEPPETECTSNAQCPEGWRCSAGVCIEGPTDPGTGEEDSDEDGLPDDWEEDNFGSIDAYDGDDDPDNDGSPNMNEYYANTDPNDPNSTPGGSKPKKDRTLALILLIVGLVFMLGGGGYLFYDYYVNKDEREAQAAAQLQQQPTIETQGKSPEEIAAEQERMRKEQERAMKERKALQEQIRAKRQQEKVKKRRDLLSSFKTDDDSTEADATSKEESSPEKKDSDSTLASSEKTASSDQKEELSTDDRSKKTTLPEKSVSVQKTSASPVTQKAQTLTNSDQKKPSAEKKDAFKDLAKITQKSMSNKEAFAKLSEISGSSTHQIRKIINNKDHKPEDISNLFKDAKKIDVRPNKVTPVLKHLIAQGHVKDHIIQRAVHQLHEQKLLTKKQKQKVLDDLK